MDDQHRFLLLQAREPGDEMATHERECFARALQISPDRLVSHDLLSGPPDEALCRTYAALLIGGSGDHSVLGGGAFMTPFLDFLSNIVVAKGIPTFASCFGFQALALAGGGDVVTDDSRAEVGTYEIKLTEAGAADPLFGDLAPSFQAQLGHKDHVLRLPAGMTRLAYSDQASHQALRVDGTSIVATQFHPELTRRDNTQRYLRYWEAYGSGDPDNDPVLERMNDSPQSTALLRRWVAQTL